MNAPASSGRFLDLFLRIYRTFRAVVLNLLFLFFVLIVVSSLMGTPTPPIPAGAVLELDPSGIIVEQRSVATGASQLLDPGNGVGEVVLADLLRVIDEAAGDSRIQGMVLRTEYLAGGAFSHLQDVGRAIARFRATGKPVYALAGNYTQGQYYLASQADEIMLNPMGSVGLEGFGTWQLYFGEALRKLGIQAHIFRVGTYKAAVEPFERNDMSPEAKSNFSDLFDDLWDQYLRDVSDARQLPQNAIAAMLETLDDTLARYQGDSAALALGEGLVDRVESAAASDDYVDSRFEQAGNPPPRVGYRRYLASLAPQVPTPGASRIGLVIASGEIVDGEAMPGNVGGDTLAQLIREATDDERLAALVLRIDSPGGSAFASEVIRGELEAFRATDRPLVVSMGSMAASGGYWIATPASAIVASASTITGSIGIYGVLPTFEEGFARLGLSVDGVGTTSLSGAGTPGLSLSPLVERSLQLTVENGYQRFISLVADARDMDPDAVDLIAQGQVWTGRRARDLGLVDELGDLQRALDLAAERAEVTDYVVVPFEVRLSPFERLLQQLLDNPPLAQLAQGWRERTGTPAAWWHVLDSLWRLPRYLNDPNALYLHCEVCAGGRVR